MKELWKDVPGYEGLYQVSNLGRIKRLPYQTIGRTKGRKKEYIRVFRGGVLKPYLGKNGYYVINLYSNGKYLRDYLHRIIAKTFIPNPNNYPCINHKDEVRTNNNVDNLEWCSYSYNNTYGNARDKFAKSYSRNHSRAVEMLSLSGEKIREFSSVKEAAIFVGGTYKSIDRAIAKTRKTAYGYIWNLI